MQGTRCLACRACSLCRAPVVCPELHPEFERTLNKRVQKAHKDGHKVDTETGTFGLQRHNSGAVPVQFRTHDTIHAKDTRGCMSGSSRKTRHGSGAVPVQFRHSSGARQQLEHSLCMRHNGCKHDTNKQDFDLLCLLVANRSDCVLGTLRDGSKFTFFRLTQEVWWKTHT
jgi:hypothetical protein